MIGRLRRLERWKKTLLIVFLAQLFSAVGFSTIFPFLPLYIEELGSSTGTSVEVLSGLVISSQAFTMMLAAPIWGALADRHGRKLMVVRATLGGAVVLGLMAFVRSSEELVILRAVQGLVTGTVAAANALVAAEAPREQTGFAMGVVQVGLWSGISLGPLIGGLLADAFGYRVSFLVTAVLLLLAGLLVLFGVREQFESQARFGPDRMGFVTEWRHVMSMQGVIPTYIARFLTGIARNLITPIMPLFIASLMPGEGGVSAMTGLITGVASATGTLGAIVLGRVGDRYGHRSVLIGSAAVLALLHVPQTFATATWQLLVLQALTGFAAGGIVSAPSALLAQYTPPGEEGAVYGLDNSVLSGARTVSPLLGSLFSVALGMRSTFMVTAILFVLVAGAAYVQLPRYRRAPLPAEAPVSPAATD